MIVIYVNSMEDTSTFSSIYKDLIDCKLLYNPTREEVIDMLEKHPHETTLCFGHGNIYGLFNKDFSGFLIDNSMVHLLKDREVIGIWCYAKVFAFYNNLKGFFTDMFISNNNEAEFYCCKGNDEDVIMEQNKLFADNINTLIKDNTPIELWVNILNESADKTINFVDFNYSRLVYYKGNKKNEHGEV